jgi:hypothetical protein
MAFAAEPESATNGPINRHANTTGFILNRPSPFLGRALHNGFVTKRLALLCDAKIEVNYLESRLN